MLYEEAINYLESLAGFGIRPGLQRIKKLLEILGEPQKKYKTIHVTGTNGKGSVCAILSQTLTAANIKTGLFTSPHLVSYCERIKINNEDISENDFTNLVDLMKKSIDKMLADGEEHPTLFETLTAMAFKYFADQKVEYAVIEVGLGGLLDSTNVIIPEVSVITNVANDHAEKCGGNILGIAKYKAGIIKPNIPVVTGATGEPLKIIRDAAKLNNSKLYVLDEDFFIDESIEISLQGEYQKFNYAIAAMTAKIINSELCIPNSELSWAGRFELFILNGKQIVIDGAHNGAGAAALRESLDKKFPNSRRVFLFGVLKDKDIDVIIDNLFTAQDYIIVTRPNSERAAAPEDICKRLQSKSIKSVAVNNNDEAFEKFINSNGDLFISAGSLYLIGYIRKLLISK